MVRRCNLAEVEGDGVASLYEFACRGGRPWWLYICSQLGFTRGFLTSTPSWRVGPCGLHVSFERASLLDRKPDKRISRVHL
jgi:hypothetical protein